ncbi:MAG: triose-phosphate isomerase [Deltaproteobacteria bacterium]|nr:triose-phosphate isomerase [Deltaproteobacteria bacterium]
MRPPLVVGNWKMHGAQTQASTLARAIRRGVKSFRRVEVALAPPFTALGTVGKIIQGSRVELAGQNVYWENEGAFTGEVSPTMLRALGCRFVIVGHSERRRLFNEGDEAIAKKMLASVRAGLRPILCIGETLAERQKRLTYRILSRQLRAGLKGLGKNGIETFEVAYEPVWAIGTGRNASPEQVSEAHRWIRGMLGTLCGKKVAKEIRILYGGSVRPDNAPQLAATEEVNGSLVGGASLRAPDFLRIIRSFASPSARQ